MASYGLSLGVARMNERLPAPVYALLTGLNAATVGIIALAAVQLSQKAITDKVTRILVFLGATAGMLYNALWYFPLLMLVGGTATITWDYRWGHNLIRWFRPNAKAAARDSEAGADSMRMKEMAPANVPDCKNLAPCSNNADLPVEDQRRIVPASIEMRVFSWKLGLTIIAFFFATFTVIMTLRGVLNNRPRGFNLFANLYLAGTWYRHI